MSIRILIVDDHTLFREGLLSLFLGRPGLSLVGQAAHLEEALQLVRATKTDIVLLDYHLPATKGLDGAKQLLALPDAPKIIILTGSPDLSFVPEAIRAGVTGFLRKEASSAELLEAITQVHEGKTYLCSEASTSVFNSVRASLSPDGTRSSPGSVLSAREEQVLALVAKGLRNKEIADQIGTSVKSVETYRSRIMSKLNFNSSAELMRYAVQHGY